MNNYTFYVTTSQNGDKGQGNTQTYVGTDRHMNLIGYTGRHTGIATTHPIGLEFSGRRIQLYLWWEKTLNLNHFLYTNYCLLLLSPSPCKWNGAYRTLQINYMKWCESNQKIERTSLTQFFSFTSILKFPPLKNKKKDSNKKEIPTERRGYLLTRLYS